MADRLTREKRSWNMSRIKSGNTKPEIAVRKALHALGFRFRLHRTDLPGKPDIVLAKFRTAVFVHGCFWHRHQGCRYAYTPKSRLEFWERKFEANIRRDRVVADQFASLGWYQLVVWECQTKNRETLDEILKSFFIRQTRNTDERSIG